MVVASTYGDVLRPTTDGNNAVSSRRGLTMVTGSEPRDAIRLQVRGMYRYIPSGAKTSHLFRIYYPLLFPDNNAKFWPNSGPLLWVTP